VPFAVEVLEEDRLVCARWYGGSDRAETRAAVAMIKQEVRAHPVEGVLLDFRQASAMLTLDEATDVGAEFATFMGRRRLAFVTTSPAHNRLLSHIARQTEPHGVDIDVFEDEAAAMKWLHSPDSN
jgi:hypothetical protein